MGKVGDDPKVNQINGDNFVFIGRKREEEKEEEELHDSGCLRRAPADKYFSKSGSYPHQEGDEYGDHRKYEKYCNKQLIPEPISTEQAVVIILLNIIILVHGDKSL